MKSFFYAAAMLLLYAAMLLFFFLPHCILAQGYIRSDYLSSSTFRDEAGNKLGAGSLVKISGGYSLPFSVRQNRLNQPTAWSASVSGTYGELRNRGVARELNPEKIVNVGLNLSHVRPLSDKWMLIASVGGGIYSEPDKITTESLLASGGAIFVYKMNNRLDLGVGLGLTNSYGVPIVMPMLYVKWDLPGRYEVKVNFSTQMEIAAAARFGERFRLKLVAIEMDGLSAVVKREGQSMIYSSAMIRSFLTPELRIGKSACLFAGGGGVWSRTSDLTKRSLKSFWNKFKEGDDGFYFKPSGYVTVGFRYGF